MQDLLGNDLKVGDLCYYLKTYTTQVKVGLVEIVSIKGDGVVCLVVNPNPTIDQFRGVHWKVGHLTKPLAPTNLIKKGT